MKLQALSIDTGKWYDVVGFRPDNSSAGPSTQVHKTEGAANVEARRLSNENPGKEFFVAKLVRRMFTPAPVQPKMEETRL